MSQSVFADGVYGIGIINGMVRIEFATRALLDRDEDGKHKFEQQACIVMTPQSFLQTFGKMQELIHKMEEAGLIADKAVERREGPARNTSAPPVIVKEDTVVTPVASKAAKTEGKPRKTR